ncbi:hypothetical protein B0H14DRAFT_2841512 [Mycena olivaceomarginata]|nr:hypothetical protein B0H14DRAFT_2841512 [Mycena olivaceomarginata]
MAVIGVRSIRTFVIQNGTDQRLHYAASTNYPHYSQPGKSSMAPSVLLIGASGALGRPLVEEFQKQRARFNRVAILADPERAHKFSEVQKNGIEVISGSFLDFKVYQGVSLPFFTGSAAAHHTAASRLSSPSSGTP